MSDEISADIELSKFIERLRGLAKAPEEITELVATELERVIGENIAAGRGPDGVPWQPTQEGRQPLRKAANAMMARAYGTVAVITLTGPEARHSMGWVKGGIKRQILPDNELPGPLKDAIENVVNKYMAKALGGNDA